MASPGISFVSHSCRHSGSSRTFHHTHKAGGIGRSTTCFSGRGRFPATSLLLEQDEEPLPPRQGQAHNPRPGSSWYQDVGEEPQEDGSEASRPHPSGWLSEIQHRLILGGKAPSDLLRERARRQSGDGADGNSALRCDGNDLIRHENGSSGDQSRDFPRECGQMTNAKGRTKSDTRCGAATACSGDRQDMPALVAVTSRHRHFASAFACEARSFGYMPVNASNTIFAVNLPDHATSRAGTGQSTEFAQCQSAWLLEDGQVPNLNGTGSAGEGRPVRDISLVLHHCSDQDGDQLDRDQWVKLLNESQWKHMAGLRLVVREHQIKWQLRHRGLQYCVIEVINLVLM